LKRNKSTGTNKKMADLLQAGDEILRSEIQKHINYIWNEEELSDEWKESITLPI
jgi:hypothetical protein